MVKTSDGFDFSFQPSIKREQIERQHELGFIERKESVVFLGPPGVGKTHLAISLAIAAAKGGRAVSAVLRRMPEHANRCSGVVLPAPAALGR